MRLDRVDAPWVIDGPINGEWFRLYVEKVLLPTLYPDDLVVVDNLTSHCGKTIYRLIRSVGDILGTVSPAECQNYFTNSGYGPV